MPPVPIALAEPDGAGGFFVGGSFDEINRSDAPTLVHIESNGTVGPWRPPAPLLPSAMALGMDDRAGTALYVAANTDVPENRGLVVIDAALGRRLSASPYGFRQISKLAINSGRMLAVDSDGSKSGGDSIQLRDLDGSNGRTVPVSGGRVHAVLATFGGFFVGGDFTKIGNANRLGLAHIDDDGTVTSFNAGLEPGSDVYAIAATGSRVFLGGHLRVPPPRGQKLDLRDILVFARTGQRLAPIAGLDVHILKELAIRNGYLLAASLAVGTARRCTGSSSSPSTLRRPPSSTPWRRRPLDRDRNQRRPGPTRPSALSASAVAITFPRTSAGAPGNRRQDRRVSC